VVALSYRPETEAPPRVGSERGAVSTYAQGSWDYHRVMSARLRILERVWCEVLYPGARARRFTDTAPLLERAYARLAGLGFVGKNTCLIDPHSGSFLFLGGVILDRALAPSVGDVAASCGGCTACLDACPTQAFPAPHVLDARRCISYLTIEARGPYPDELREGVGPHVYGCDICQTVCPWNHKFAPPGDPELAPVEERAHPPLDLLFRRARDGFKSLARGAAWTRTGKRGFLRNVATVMGNTRDPRHRPALEELAAHDDPGVSEHARWALERLDPPPE
jgi:epoxyqueuosine reductase